MPRWTAIAVCSILLCWSAPFALSQTTTLTFDQPQTAGISGFRALWDTPVVLSEDGAVADVDQGQFGKAPSAYWMPDAKARMNADGTLKPGGLVFDAVHRGLLVRFPGAAAAIADKLGQGYSVAKLELALPFKATELWPEGYDDPAGMSFLGAQWAHDSPHWHALAWALRKPWRADDKSGPTFNAAIDGVSYWKRFGATDTKEDRYPASFGPAQVSAEKSESVDITASLNDPGYGKTAAERLRRLEYCGFLVQKEETYDLALFRGSYEWQTARGGQGILIDTPRLVVTFAPGPAIKVPAQELSFDFAGYTAGLQQHKSGGAPTALFPTAEQYDVLKAKLGFARPPWMNDWQWRRVSEMEQMGGAQSFPSTYDDYLKWIDGQLARPPRSWWGFDAVETTQSYFKYQEALPEPVKDEWKRYWWAWLMPDRPFDGFQFDGKTYTFAQGYIGGKEMQAYQDATHDWRGNASVYRTYVHAMGTMNFNHWAAAGVLLGGKIIESDPMMAEGRAGLEQWPLRTWSWYDGSTQESIDHYYFSLSLASQKVFADFGPQPMDRMMGQSMLGKSVEELAGAFHPGLRRFISTSGRTGIAYLLGIQDGLQGIMHSLSPAGAYTDLGATKVSAANVRDMPVIGHDTAPGVIAFQTLNGPWAPDWYANIVDDKPLPYEMTVTYKQWGAYNATPLWKKSYLGHNYGMASLDVSTGNETVPVMAQWRREAKTAASMTDIGTLLVRPGINRTELLDSLTHGTDHRNPNGSVGTQGSHIATLQYKNKAIVLTSPYARLEYQGGRPVPAKVTSLQTTVGLFNFQANPTWELFVDGQKVAALPYKAKFGAKIAIRDGVSYIGLIPIAATDLGRDTEVEIADDGVMTDMQGGGKAREALRINAYNYRSDTPLDLDRPDLVQAYAGYAVEMGDVDDYKTFDEFQRHLATTTLETQWDAANKRLNLKYVSGGDTLECTYIPAYTGAWNHAVPTTEIFPMRKVNGQWPYLAPGMDRDSTLTQQGTTGTLEKNGATLATEPGRMAALQTEPLSGTYVGLNPFSDPTTWKMTLPGGITLQANGQLGMARVTVRPAENKIWIDYGLRDDQKNQPNMATSLIVTGWKTAPIAQLNDRPIKALPTKADGQSAYTIPLITNP